MRIEDFDHLYTIYENLTAAEYQSKLSDEEKRESGIRKFYSEEQGHKFVIDLRNEMSYLYGKWKEDSLKFFKTGTHCKEDLVLEFSKDISYENFLAVLIFYIELKGAYKVPHTICCHFPDNECQVAAQTKNQKMICDRGNYFYSILQSIEMVYNLKEVGRKDWFRYDSIKAGVRP